MSLAARPCSGVTAAFLALWAAHAKRERLKRTRAAAHAHAAHLARDAAAQAKHLALIQTITRYWTSHPPKAKPPEHDASTTPEEALLADAAEGRAPQPGPPKPDGSFDPFRGRGLWDNEHGPVTPTPQPVDVAKWKQADYQGVAAYQGAMRADEAFDAEVGATDATSQQHCFNWNIALDPIEFVDTVKVLFVPAGTALLGGAFLGMAFGLCDTAAGCALAPFAVFNAGAHFTAAVLSGKGAWEYLRHRWHEITNCEVEP